MIADELEYEVTKRNIAKFEEALTRLELTPPPNSPAMLRLMKFEYQRQLDALRAELADYVSRRQERRSA